MAGKSSLGGPLVGLVRRFASRLRFPQLFFLAATLFVVDLLIPDLLPFVDEILLALLTLLLANLREEDDGEGASDGSSDGGGQRPMKDVTPRSDHGERSS